MANSQHIAALRRGVSEWNRWRLENPTVVPDLSGASLQNWDLRGVFLEGANLSRCDFTGTHLDEADLREADLTDAVFFGTNLSHAGLIGAKFTVSQLKSAHLCQTGFSEDEYYSVQSLGHIVHADSHVVIVDSAPLTDFDRRFLLELGTLQLIELYAPSKTTLSPKKLFISYSSEDAKFAATLDESLRAAGFDVWFAPRCMKNGRKIHDQINEAIRECDRFLLVLSDASISSSWCKTELFRAYKHETESGRRIIFPLRLTSLEALKAWECVDVDSGKDLSRELREFFMSEDFSGWRDQDVLARAIQRLIEDLRP